MNPVLEFYLTNLFLNAGLLLLPLLIIKFVEKKKFSLKDFGFRSKGISKDISLTLFTYSALMIVSLLLGIIFIYTQTNDFEPVQDTLTKVFAISPFVIVYFFVIRIFFEEWFFRAFLVPRIGVIGSSVLFGIAHLGYGSFSEIAGAMVLGTVLALFYKYNRQIVPNYVAHLLYNATVVLLWGL